VENKKDALIDTALWWIRRDLRLSDNLALVSALQQAKVVIPVFILDPRLLASPYVGQARLGFLFEGLRALDASLRSRGSRLIIRQGDPQAVIRALSEETGAENTFAEADVSPYARQRDERLKRELPLVLLPGVTAHPCADLHKADGSPYTVFTPFSRMWCNLPFPGKPLAAPERLPQLPALPGLDLPPEPRHPGNSPFPAEEAEAQSRLAAFTDFTINRYHEDRNRMDLAGTSGLSPYLRFGMLSARQAAWAARQAEARAENQTARQGAETWLNELIWREFYAAILYYFPYIRRMALRPELRNIPWRDAPSDFAAWTEGHTGYPVVDAAMRQLNTIGWMHNRARMIVASFLTKDLLIDWRLGERYFMQHLLDGDPAANNGGWQWTAGTGADAAPYFRVFNPILQGKKFDPQGVYVRRWVPELAAVPDQFLHAPWEMPVDIQRRAGCMIGKDYPTPIVDHALARQRVIVAYQSGRKP
jgi:deoxyribodipyrimidine photo-lyase